jgi:hypothetical protein
MRFCAIGRTLGEHLGYVAATATSVSSASAARASRGRSDNTNAADPSSATQASGHHELS